MLNVDTAVSGQAVVRQLAQESERTSVILQQKYSSTSQ